MATDSHRWVAAEALLRLGHGDASFVALRPVLQAGGEWESPRRSSYFIEPLIAAWQQGLVLAAAAWPEAAAGERIEKLAALAGES